MDRDIIIASLIACEKLLPSTSPYMSRIKAELQAQQIEARTDAMRAYRPTPECAKIGMTIDIRL